MRIKVLVVDDSGFFRRQISKLLAEDNTLEVIGTAENGKEAVEKALTLKPDVITMDIEMPVMDGISATREILRHQRVPILIFSTLTIEGAKATLDAMDAGAVDFIPKRFEDISHNRADVGRVLCEKIHEVGRQSLSISLNDRNKKTNNTSAEKDTVKSKASIATVTDTISYATKKSIEEKVSKISKIKETKKTQSLSVKNKASVKNKSSVEKNSPVERKTAVAKHRDKPFKLLAIGTSTGGPLALQKVLKVLPENFPLPIILIQHMPSTFTPAFAHRLDQLCEISVKEASDGDQLKAGCAYLAPGGMQMKVKKHGTHIRLEVYAGEDAQTYKPSVDITFESIAEAIPKDVLAVMLTGMGHDGCAGSQKLYDSGASIWAQDEQSSVVWGMPAAVVEAGIAEKVIALNNIGNQIVKAVQHD